MKNLKKLSRNDLKSLVGGKRLPGNIAGGDCGSVCSPGDGYCEQYGLLCGIHMINNGGTVTSSCWKCA